MSRVERNYFVIEREDLGMVYSLQKFRHYLLGSKVTFHVDHQALPYLVNKPQLSERLATWVLLLQEFDYSVVHTPGRLHQVANYLSRLETGEAPKGIYDDLLDANLFSIQLELTKAWYD